MIPPIQFLNKQSELKLTDNLITQESMSEGERERERERGERETEKEREGVKGKGDMERGIREI